MGLLTARPERQQINEAPAFYVSRMFVYGHPPIDPNSVAQAGMWLKLTVALGMLAEEGPAYGHQVELRFALDYAKWDYPPGPPRRVDVDRLWDLAFPYVLDAVARWRAGQIPEQMTAPLYL